jgi:ABC-type multidrug transport system fused ATPase/permease subunit
MAKDGTKSEKRKKGDTPRLPEVSPIAEISRESYAQKTLWILQLAFRTAPWVIATMAICTVAAGVLPAVIAWVGRMIVDAVVVALAEPHDGWESHRHYLYLLLGAECSLVVVLLAAQRGLSGAQSILRARLANGVTELIVSKSLTLSLEHFEDPDIHDRLMRARRDASVRPLNLVTGLFTVARNFVTFASCIVVLAQLSWWAVLIVIIAGLPVFIAELRYSQRVFDQQRKRSPEQREQGYLESLLTREDYAKEVKLYALGERLLERLRGITKRAENEEHSISVHRNFWGFVFSTIGTAAFYGAYAWIVRKTVHEHMSLGEMTMYIAIFRQAQGGVTSGLASLGLMLDDQLYLRDLQSFLALPIPVENGTATTGPHPEAGLEVEHISFTYLGSSRPALDDVTFSIRPGQMLALVGQNGSGKTTLLKLITRLYEPSKGTIKLDGLDIKEWDPDALRRRFALVFQDFARLKMKAGENIGAGDVDHWNDEERWERAAKKGLAHEFIAALPDGYHVQLGKWFRGGTELSGGQWQKIALSRAFMREENQIVVLDEPTAALDPDAEHGIVEHVEQIRGHQAVLLISHRFGSVRIADRIVVLERGKVIEEGQHAQLMAAHGHYARLFDLQAAGYVGAAPQSERPPRKRRDDSGPHLASEA